MSFCMLLTFGFFFLILFLSFPETNLGSAEKETKVDSSKERNQGVHEYENVTVFDTKYLLIFS